LEEVGKGGLSKFSADGGEGKGLKRTKNCRTSSTRKIKEEKQVEPGRVGKRDIKKIIPKLCTGKVKR